MIFDRYIVFIQNMKNYEIIGFYTINDDLKLYKSMHSGNYWGIVVDLKNANIRISLDLKKYILKNLTEKVIMI